MAITVGPGGCPYQVLGVPRVASAAEIRRAYRAQALTCHPDKGGNAEAFRSLVAAFKATVGQCVGGKPAAVSPAAASVAAAAEGFVRRPTGESPITSRSSLGKRK